MPAPNRVTPFGSIEALHQRGGFLGNRGSIHRADRAELARQWSGRRWITCTLSYRGWRAPMWEPGRWTALFFLDEAVALAAGHRPCALCRRGDFERFMTAWEATTGARPRVDGPGGIDERLHEDRIDPATRRQRTHQRGWLRVPDGTYVVADDGAALLVHGDRLLPWPRSGERYGPPRARPRAGRATVLTPAVTVELLRSGYTPALAPGVTP